MGIKFLILQMIPWCFPMADGTACHQADPPAATSSSTAATAGSGAVKLIRMDGRVEVYHRPVSVSELMSDHPKHLVCRSDAFTIGQRIPALAEGEELQPGHAYFLLPVHFFQSVLSFVTLASSFARAAAAVASPDGRSPAPALLQRPFDVHRTPSGMLQIRLSDEFIERMKEAQEGGGEVWTGTGAGPGGGGGRVCTTAALEKDYRQLVVGTKARQWKPKLETIKETEKGRESAAAVSGGTAAFGDIRRRKTGHQDDHQTHHQKQQQQQKPKHKVSTISQLLNSPPPHKSKGKKLVACDL